MRRSILALFILSTLSGCSLVLDFDPEGLSCDSLGNCREGYVCNADNQCMAEGHPSTLCTPECGALERCVKSECVPVCEDRACPAGSLCVEGECRSAVLAPRLGSPCLEDSECAGVGKCLLPYGGGKGVCTTVCSSESECGADAPRCQIFDNGRPAGIKLCVNPAFKPCASEEACAESGLSCGVYAFVNGSTKEPVTACTARRTGSNASIGQPCSQGIPCANGLCVKENGSEYCTTPCQVDGECVLLGGTGNVCRGVPLNTDRVEPLPSLRPKLCVKGEPSLLAICSASALTCHADAALCAVLNPSETKCVTPCTDGNDRCPSATGALRCQALFVDGAERNVCVP